MGLQIARLIWAISMCQLKKWQVNLRVYVQISWLVKGNLKQAQFDDLSLLQYVLKQFQTLDTQEPTVPIVKWGKMGNIFRKLFSSAKLQKQQSKILMLGLDSAGKTTILYSLKLGQVTHTIPTIGFNVQQLQYQKVSFMVWDVGGQQKLRNLWSHYYENTNGLIFVVDSSDLQRVELSARELARIINHELMAECVVLVLANKRDVAMMSLQMVCEKMGLRGLKRNWAIFPITAIKETDSGLKEALQWLVDNINHVSHFTKKIKVG